VLTPTPDVVNQTLMAVPIIILYEISIIMIRLLGKKKESPEPENDVTPDPAP
jgi:sec-independent protein translocase protein TatC